MDPSFGGTQMRSPIGLFPSEVINTCKIQIGHSTGVLSYLPRGKTSQMQFSPSYFLLLQSDQCLKFVCQSQAGLEFLSGNRGISRIKVNGEREISRIA
ncbi:hypothetical protein RRG08_034775 [Elysia crispata]|uniref:Uncharacterized protein n=1 Tax=Elysia crispata TaxID=231223 RepID=A0AAE1CVA2_9GAST|nr:hypothetical protein RRG08_034775 [Elysia crispata]